MKSEEEVTRILGGTKVGRVRVNEIRPGMILAQDVRDFSGRMLVAAGIPMTETHLRVMKMWGVTEVEISGTATSDDHKPSETHLLPEKPEAIDNEMAMLFHLANRTNPIVDILFDLIREAKLRKIAEEPKRVS